MEITQSDRDLLRQKQQKLNSSQSFKIGNIVEHKIQDPVSYKAKSRQEQGLSKDDIPPLPTVEYKSVLLDNDIGNKSSADDELSNLPINGGESDEGLIPMTTIIEEDKLLSNLPITPDDVQTNLWLNMDRVEFEKLEWMSDKADREYQVKIRSTVHFDSDGKALPPTNDNSATGSREVHDVNSLVKLLDSAYPPQVTYALNVISKIATRATIGLYDDVFDENIHQILLKECLLRVRHNLDNSNETTCQAAMKCLRSLLCNTQVDEIFLDKLSPIKSKGSDVTMWLNSEQGEFDLEMKDSDCIGSDAILGLIARTDLLNRFKYLLIVKNESKFSNTYYDCILDILIRIARYSPDICWILNNNDFPNIIIDRFLPLDITTRSQLQQSFALRSLKFLRIMASASNELETSNSRADGPSIKLSSSIVPMIRAYYYVDCSPESNCAETQLRIQIETLRLMNSLYELSDFKGHIFSTITLEQNPMIQRARILEKLDPLKRIESTSSLDWQYAASLIDLVGRMMSYERLHTARLFVRPLWSNFIRPVTFQWLTKIIRARVIPHQDVSITIYVAANTFHDCRDEQAIQELNSILVGQYYELNDQYISESLVFFRYLVREATNETQIDTFLKHNGCRRDPLMLKSYGFMNYNTSDRYSYKLNSVIDLNTPYILLDLFLSIIQKAHGRPEDLLRHYIDNVDITRYIRVVNCYHKYPHRYESEVQKSMLAQFGIQTLANALLMMANHYLGMGNRIGCDFIDETPHTESTELAVTRKECYSQFILSVVSVIGLMNPDVERMLSIKDLLLEKVIMSECLQSRLVDENSLTIDELRKGTKFHELNGRNYDSRFADHFAFNELDLRSLGAIYLSCEQPGRFWIFQPLIEYYCFQINEVDESKRVKNGKWFLQNINRISHNKLLPADCSDIDVISLVLKLNLILMQRSPQYMDMVVKQNIEEYLCLVGSIFLDDELFLDGKMNSYIWHNLEIILTASLRHGLVKLFSDASRNISSLKLKLIDFFNKLVDQYEAASYNDVAFTNFLLLFISPNCDKVFRRKLFSEKLESCLSQVRIARSEVWIPDDLLTKDKERDSEIKSLIRRSQNYIKKSTYLDFYSRWHCS